MRIEGPAGTWHVRRRWAPRRLGAQTVWQRFRQRFRWMFNRAGNLSEVGDVGGCGIDILEGLVVLIVILVVALVVVFLGIPLLIALGELALLVVVILFGLIGKVVFRRPWIIDAVDPEGRHHEWPIVGWRASGAGKRLVAERVAATGWPPSHQEVAAAVAAV